MKNRVFIVSALLLLTGTALNAQHYIGLRGGVGGGFGRFTPTQRDNQIVWGLWSGGIAWKHYDPAKYLKNFGYGAIGMEVEFLQRGFQYNNTTREDDYYRRTINTINVPLIWQPHIVLAKDKARLFLNLGIALSINLNSWETVKSGGTVTEMPYEPILIRDNPLGYGLQGGLGFDIAVSERLELMIEGRYYFTYGDILRNESIYPSNPRRSPIDNFSVSIGFFYKLGVKPERQSLDSHPALQERGDVYVQPIRDAEAAVGERTVKIQEEIMEETSNGIEEATEGS